ncbi:MAG: hypothetical protein GX061_08180 [Eubacteriaceae bacterium]|nr:hypothetical protein [Eubacteriaceae bacterium]
MIAYGGDTTPGGISYGVRTKSITVSSGTLTAEGGTAQTTSFGVYCDGGSITVTGGTLTAKGGATTMDSYGAQAGASGITVSGGTFTAEGGTANGGNSNGVYSYDHIIVSGGTFKATGGTASSGDSHGIKVGSGVSITLTGGSTTAIGNTAAVNKSPDFTNAVQTDPYWYLWKESTTTTAPTGDFNSSSNTSTYTYNSGHKYLEFKSKTPLTGISLSTNDPQVGTAINATNLLPSGATASYQWYTNSSASVTGGTLATGTGNNTASYTPISSDAGKYLYVVATGTGNYNGTASAVTSNQVGISPSINTQPTNQTIAEGQTTTFTVSATGYPTPSYKWEVSDGGGVWTEISAVTGASYTTSAATTDMNGFKYRCIVSNSAGSVTSDEVTLTVTADPPSSENKISGITAGEVYTSGDTVTFTASGGGIPNESPKTGDKWWLPTAWETNPSGNFTGGYTQSFSTEGMSVGDHTLTVTFTQQSYNGTAWENTLISDNKTVSFTVRAATTSPETGDSASIYLYGVVMLIASGSMIWLLTAKKKKAKA